MSEKRTRIFFLCPFFFTVRFPQLARLFPFSVACFFCLIFFILSSMRVTTLADKGIGLTPFPYAYIQKKSIITDEIKLNAFGLLPIPSRLWEIPFSTDEQEHSEKSGVLVNRPAILRRSRLGWSVIPRGLCRVHGDIIVRRGKITEFSKKSQSRLECLIQSYDVKWQSFVTLTFHVPYMEDRKTGAWNSDYLKNASEGLNIKYHLGERKVKGGGVETDFGQDMNLAFRLMRAWVRSITESARFRGGLLPPLFIWKKEFTSRGVVHFHLLTTARLKCHVKPLQKRWAELTKQPNNRNSCDIQIPKNQELCGFYLAKYVSKYDKENNAFCTSAPLGLCFDFLGRWWGVINRRPWEGCKVADVDFPIQESTFKVLFRRMISHVQKVSRKKWLKRHKDLYGFNLPYKNVSPDKFFCVRCFRDDEIDDIITKTLTEPVGEYFGGWGFFDDVAEKQELTDSQIPFWFSGDTLASLEI